MRDLDDEKKIKAYMAAKMAHIKMYHECMNLADGLDVEKFAKLVRADEREACIKAIEDEVEDWDRDCKETALEAAEAIRARGWEAGYGAVAPKVEPPETESGGGFESPPAPPPSIEAAVLAEREACAEICETIYQGDDITRDWLEDAAAAIRKRGEK